MKRKGWLTPILVFIICISFLLTYQARQGGSYLARTVEAPTAPWNIDVSNISKIEFNESSKNFTAAILDSKWQLLSPLETTADSAYIYNILSTFASPSLVGEVSSNVTDLKQYGIDKFSKSIKLYDTYRNEYELICGKEASSSTYYVYSPNTQTIYTMHKEYFDNLSYNLSEWRDKDYLHFNPEMTSKIKVHYGNEVHILEPTLVNDKVTFTSATLSQDITDTIFNFLVTTRVNAFIVDEASPNVISSYGFDKPEVTITIVDTNNEVLTFGMNHSTDKANQSYVMLKGHSNIFAVSSFQQKMTQQKIKHEH